MSGKKVILFTIGSLMLGGAENQLLMLASGMRSRGHEVHLFVVSNIGPLQDSFENAGVIVHLSRYSAKGSRFSRILRLMRAEWELIRLTAKLRPDVIHNFLPLTNFMGALAGWIVGVRKVITSRRALGTHQDRVPVAKFMDRVANFCSHLITANSKAVAEDVIRRDNADPDKISVIYNGLDLPDVQPDQRRPVRRELGIADDAVAAVCVANLIPYKGHRDLIAAMPAVVQKFPKMMLVLIGEDRGIGQELKDYSQGLGVANHIIWTGQQRNVPRLLGGMDVGVLVSHEEGFSNALLELLRAGLPVIATQVGGNAEALDGMPGCTLVASKKPREIEAALMETLDSLGEIAKDAEVRQSLVRDRYSPEVMLDCYSGLYK